MPVCSYSRSASAPAERYSRRRSARSAFSRSASSMYACGALPSASACAASLARSSSGIFSVVGDGMVLPRYYRVGMSSRVLASPTAIERLLVVADHGGIVLAPEPAAARREECEVRGVGEGGGEARFAGGVEDQAEVLHEDVHRAGHVVEVFLHHARAAVAEHPGRGSAAAQDLVHRLEREALALRHRERFRGRGDVDAAEELVDDLHLRAGAILLAE